MDISEARQMVREFYRSANPDEKDEFLFTEAMEYIIQETSDPHTMLELGGWYYEKKFFLPALKYYEMAAEYQLPEAYECLGYIWYYGRTGKKDYEKAFHYYSLAADAGSLQAAYKVADMYKNGYAVERDYEEYKRIIESLYPKVKNARRLGEPLPEVFTRLGRIRAEQGRTEEALQLFLQAKDFQAQRLKYDAYFGNLNIMMWLIDDIYELVCFDAGDFDFYDLFYLLKEPVKVMFYRGRKRYMIEAKVENGIFSIDFNGQLYRNREDFFAKARLNGVRLTAIEDELYGFCLLEGVQ